MTDDLEPTFHVEHLQMVVIMVFRCVKPWKGKTLVFSRRAGLAFLVKLGEHEADLQRFHRAILVYWVGTPTQPGSLSCYQQHLCVRQSNGLQEIHGERRERFLAKCYKLVRDQFVRASCDT